jgi:hypothetical protein
MLIAGRGRFPSMGGTMRILLRILHSLMAGLFLFAAALQYNDDDMLRWIAIYLAAAACCLGAVIGKLKPWMPVLVAVISLGWAVIYVSRGAAGMPVGEMFAEWEMKNQQIVEEREMFGLGIIAAWMAVVWFTTRRKAVSDQRSAIS